MSDVQRETADNRTRVLRPYRDVLADRIEGWAGDAGVYNYVDRLLSDLDREGYEVAPSVCLDPGCTRELGAFCEDHGYVLYGRTEADVDGQGNPVPGQPRMAERSFREDIAMVLTVYDEHVSPENRGPWRHRLAAWVETAK